MVADDRTLCIRKPSDKPVRGGLGGWWHYRFTDSPLPKFAPPKPTSKSVNVPDVEHVDGVLTMLVRKCLVLSEPHKKSLLARGLSDAEIERCGYRSTPSPIFADRVARELSVYGLEGVPGFFKRGSEWRMKDSGPGIFVPVRDEHLRIVGLQIRRDEGEPRYIWFSSSNYPHGTSSGAPIHCSRPYMLHNTNEVLITEGALKSDVTSFLLDAPIIAAAGVSNFGQDFATNLKAKFPNIKTCIIAFDSDWRIKLPVKTALERLMRNLSGVGFRVKVRTWPPHMGKGIDDYLLALDSSQTNEVAA